MRITSEALVIGNGGYSPKLKLECPPADAEAVAKLLADLGFHVTLGIDVTYERAQDLAREFVRLVNVPTTTTSLLYYSGHGVQIEDRNYLVPVDFDCFIDEKVTKLVGVQSIIDQMTSATAVRIVLLDACRGNADARALVAGKALVVDKALYIDDSPVPATGLAELKTASNTFVAFAAAPGDVAFDGIAGAKLSPFTASLVRYLDSVDLPISNLMSRVRHDVLEKTQGRQRTWDQSSLMQPFYFNPGSMLLFMGNLMALIGLALSMIPYSLVMAWADAPPVYVAVAAAMPAAALTILLFGAQKAYSRLRGKGRLDRGHVPTMGEHLVSSLVRGVLGGYLGSLVGSLAISTIYYAGWVDPPETFAKILLEITVATIFTAILLSTCTLFLAQVTVGVQGVAIAPDVSVTRLLLGSGLGGALAGLIAAPLLTVRFGLVHDRPEMMPILLLPGAILGASVVVFSIVNFDFDQLTARRAWTSACAAFAAVASGAAAGGALFGLLAVFGIVDAVVASMRSNPDDPVPLAWGGAAYGLPVGLILGVTIGQAILLTEKWSKKAVLPYRL